MKKIVSYSKKTSLFQYIVDISSIVALGIQYITFPEKISKYIPWFVTIIIIMSIISFIIDLISQRKNNVVNRKALVKHTKKIMNDSTGKVVMFGGDLSWTDDYLSIITELTNNNQKVEIIYPRSKTDKAKASVAARFRKNVDALKNAGATVLSCEEDYHLRCTLIDVDSTNDNSDFKIITSKRLSKKKNPNKNTYKSFMFDSTNTNDKMLCDSFYQNYLHIKNICKEE